MVFADIKLEAQLLPPCDWAYNYAVSKNKMERDFMGRDGKEELRP